MTAYTVTACRSKGDLLLGIAFTWREVIALIAVDHSDRTNSWIVYKRTDDKTEKLRVMRGENLEELEPRGRWCVRLRD